MASTIANAHKQQPVLFPSQCDSLVSPDLPCDGIRGVCSNIRASTLPSFIDKRDFLFWLLVDLLIAPIAPQAILEDVAYAFPLAVPPADLCSHHDRVGSWVP